MTLTSFVVLNYVWLGSEIELNRTQLYAYFLVFNYQTEIILITAFDPVQFTQQLGM